MDAFQVRLKALRKSKKLSRRVLSELCGLHTSAIARYENGEAKPSMDSLIRLADYFGVTVDYLLGRDA